MKSILLWFALLFGPLIAVAQNQFFYDNFTRGTDPGPLSPWFTNSGVWTVTGGTIQSGPNNTSSYGDAYISSNYTAFSAQGRFKFPVGAYGGGLGGRVATNTGAHYAAWIYPETSPGGSNVVRLFKFQNWTTFGYLGSSFAPIATANLASVGTGFHTVRMDFQTNFIAVYWDNQRVIATNDIESTFFTNGAVSLDMWTDSSQYVMTADDVVVGSLGFTAAADSYSAVSGAQTSIAAPGVLLNDIGGSAPLSAFLVTNVIHGVLNLSSNGSFTYTATGGYIGTDTFWYRATDGSTSSPPAQVTITVGADHPPVAANDSYTLAVNAALSVAAPGVLVNDSDVDGNPLSALLVANAANGLVTLSNNGGFIYVPNAGFIGSDSFSYRASDGISNSGIATVSLSVVPLTLYSDNFSRGTDPGPLNDWNIASGIWTVTGGVMRTGTNGTMSYGFAYITNSFGDSATQARLRFPVGAFGGGIGSHFDVISGAHYGAWVYPENSAGGSNILRLVKFSNPSSFNTLAQSNLASVGTNFHTVKLACRGTQIAIYFDGVLTISATDPAPYTSGSASLDLWTDATGYQMSFDDVAVTGLSADDNFLVNAGSTLRIPNAGILTNDTGVFGTNLTASLSAGPTHGILTLTNNGGFAYTPTNNFVGVDTFTYQANDGTTNLGPGTVRLSVVQLNAAPVIASQPNRTIAEFSTLTITNTAADSDTPPQTLTFSLSSPPAGASIDPNTGVFTWTPNEAQGGAAPFGITTVVTDNGVPPLSSTNSFTVTVTEVNTNPVFVATPTDRTVNELAVMTVTDNATDADLPAQTLNYSLLVAPIGASISSAGVITWTPSESQGPSVSNLFQVRVVDSGSPPLSATNAFYVTVNEVNSSPAFVATPPNRTIPAQTSLTVTNIATDSDIPANPLSYSLLAAPSGSSIDPNTGIINWTPTPAQDNSTNLFTTVVTDTNTNALNALHLSVTNTFTVFVNSNPVVVLDSTALVLEGCTPTNGAIDPGETVMMSFSLKNIGTGPTTNLVATLLPTSGVAAPSGAQSYGVLPVGAVASQIFSFSATGTCGGTITPTLRIQDGSLVLGTNTISLTMGRLVNVFTQNFDAVSNPSLPPGWTTTAGGAEVVWRTTNSIVDTPTNAVFSPDSAAVGSNELVSPNISLPSGGAAILSFQHFFNFEQGVGTNFYDGGVLEIKVGTNAFADILAAAGTFVTNGYNCVLNPNFLNPLGGRQGWGGTNLTGYVPVIVSLPAASAGQTIQLKWRTGTDNGVGAGGWRVDSVVINVLSCCANTAPILAFQPDRTVDELTAMIVTNTANDPDTPASGLTYSLANPPSGATINSNGIITWIPSEAQGPGGYTITTVVSDNAFPPLSATNSFIVTVDDINSAPVLPPTTNYTTVVLSTLTVTNTASDFDIPANTLTYSLLPPVANASIDTNGVIRFTPDAAQAPGFYTLTTVATDDGTPNLSATNSFTVTVTEVNHGPVLPGTTNYTISELTTLVVTNTGTDSDVPSQTLTYSLLPPVANASIDTNGVIRFTPAESQGPGTYIITTVVTDNGYPPLSATNSFEVRVNEVNSAPVLPGTTNYTINELTTLTVTNTASDSDLPVNTLTYSLLPPVANASIDTNGVIHFTPGESQGLGTYTITTVVTDNGTPNLSATNSFTVTVNEVNSAPVLPGTTNYTIDELQPLTVTNTASDSDLPANTLTYSLLPPVANASIDTNGVIRFTPAEAQGPGTYTITTVVTDNGTPNLSATNSFTVTVNEVNSAPVLPGTTNYTINELSTLTVTNTAFDSDLPANTLTYSLLPPVANASIDTNGVIQFTPAEAQGPGTYTITTVVTDNGTPNLSATNLFTVTVNEVNSAPVLPGTTNYTIDELQPLTVTNTASDSDLPANTLTYSLLPPVANASIDTNGVIRFTPAEAQGPGTYTITTVVTDNGTPNLSATNSFTVTVNEVNTGPVLPEVTNHTINELTTLTVTNTASDSDIPANTLTYSLVSPPAHAAISTNGIITFTPDQSQAPGIYAIETVVTDNGVPSLSATNSFTVTVTPSEGVPQPVIQSIAVANEVATLGWTSISNRSYRLQFSSDLSANTWSNNIPDIVATNSLTTATNPCGSDAQRFYRVLLLPVGL